MSDPSIHSINITATSRDLGQPDSVNHHGTYALSLLYYTRGDPTKNDPPSHTALTTHPDSLPSSHVSSSSIAISDLPKSQGCTLHQVRCPSQIRYIYDPIQTTRPPEADQTLWGRCILVSSLSPCQKDELDSSLRKFGEDEINLPYWGEGNCQDWTAAVVGVLEEEGLLNTGEGKFWKEMVGKGAEEVGNRCAESGRVWVPGPGSIAREEQGQADARWTGDGRGEAGGESERGKLASRSTKKNEMVKRMRTLEGLLTGRPR